MAGHSKWANIQHRKGRQDAARSKLFSKLAKEITVAAKMGDPDPDKNPRLRLAVKEAKSQSVPKDVIDRAIKKSQGGDAESYDEIRYEGYGPGGVAVIVEAMTDNRNRTASTVRSTFTKCGGNLGETGSVSFMFDRKGQVLYPLEVGDEDTLMMAALEAGYDVTASGTTLDRFCGGGITSVNMACASVMSGMEDCVIAGGTEMMSYTATMAQEERAAGLPPMMMGSGNARLQAHHPQSHQGVCGDAIASMEGISRADVDALGLESQKRAAQAIAEGRFSKSVIPVYREDGTLARLFLLQLLRLKVIWTSLLKLWYPAGALHDAFSLWQSYLKGSHP